MKKAEIFTSPRYLCVRRNSNIGPMLSGLLKRCDERCLLRNCTPFPIDLGIFSRGNLALKGPKSNSSINGSTELQPKKPPKNSFIQEFTLMITKFQQNSKTRLMPRISNSSIGTLFSRHNPQSTTREKVVFLTQKAMAHDTCVR